MKTVAFAAALGMAVVGQAVAVESDRIWAMQNFESGSVFLKGNAIRRLGYPVERRMVFGDKRAYHFRSSGITVYVDDRGRVWTWEESQ